MKKRILSIVLVLSMLMAFMPIITSAETSGVCGYNLTWTLDDNGTLTISGTGDMTDFNYPDYGPWYNSRDSIKDVIINSGVTSIGYFAFEQCENLESITIPKGLESIGGRAFEFCRALKSLNLPGSLTSIGNIAFWGCSSLTEINVDASNEIYCSVDGNLFSKDKKTLIRYSSGKTDINYTIPDSVTSIGNDAFYGGGSLTSVTIPDSVTSIGDNAFYNCSSLTSIIIIKETQIC